MTEQALSAFIGNMAASYARAGATLLNTGRPAEAVEQLIRAAAIFPGNSKILQALGVAFASAERDAEALAMLNHALELEPSLTLGRYNLAQVYVRHGRFADAVETLGRHAPPFGAVSVDAADYYVQLIQTFALSRGSRKPEAESPPTEDIDLHAPGSVREAALRAKRLYEQSPLAHLNRTGEMVPCLSCGNLDGNRLVTQESIADAPGLYVRSWDEISDLYCLEHKHARDYHKHLIASLYGFTGSHKVAIAECRRCGALYHNFPHTPASVDRYYATVASTTHLDKEGRYGRAVMPSWAKLKLPIARYIWRRCNLKPGMNVLDIGCADGVTLWFLHFAGAKVHGIEPSPARSRYAREILGLENVKSASYDQHSYQAASFDCIYSHHVMEHVARPLEFLSAVAKHLRHGGHFVLQVPHGRKLADGAYLGPSAHHLFAFTEAYLRRAIQQAGLDVQDVDYCDKLDELPPERRDASGQLPIWGDSPGGISIVAIKSE